VTEPTNSHSENISATSTNPNVGGQRTQGMTTSERPTTTAGDPPAQGERPWQPGIAAAALVGVVAMGLAIGVAELLAAFGEWIGVFNTPASPLNSLGQTFIQFTPEWLKEFAIRTFGENDKTALTVGMGVTLLLVAVVIGIIGRRSPRIAVAITALLILVTAAAILSRAGSSAFDIIPILLGGGAGVYFLVTVFRRQVVDGTTDAAMVSDPSVGSAADSDNPKSTLSGADHPMSRAIPTGVDRRQFFKIVGIGALIAAGAGAIAKWIPSSAEVAANRESVTLPAASDVQQVTVTELDVPGITPFVTSNADFYRVDTAFVVPRVTTDEWQLHIHGAVDKEVTLSYADLIAMPSIERMITLTCVSNEVGGDLAGNARWQGVRIADVLKMAGPQAGADCVLSTSVDG
jgi:hypothetical protein